MKNKINFLVILMMSLIMSNNTIFAAITASSNVSVRAVPTRITGLDIYTEPGSSTTTGFDDADALYIPVRDLSPMSPVASSQFVGKGVSLVRYQSPPPPKETEKVLKTPDYQKPIEPRYGKITSLGSGAVIPLAFFVYVIAEIAKGLQEHKA